MELIGEAGVDLMCVCMGDHFTMGPDDAVRAVEFVRPRYVIPMHYNTFPPIRQDAEAFRAMVEGEVPAVRCIVLAPGAQHDFGD
jgi:L-ascorbate metabolism protein UlaG (beta-lactamase superfamily)